MCALIREPCVFTVPPSLRGPDLNHRSRRHQGACARRDGEGDHSHVLRPHQPRQTHRDGSHVAQHLLERGGGRDHPVRMGLPPLVWGGTARLAYRIIC